MKNRILGIISLILFLGVAGFGVFFKTGSADRTADFQAEQARQFRAVKLEGLYGSEKKYFLQNEEILNILQRKYKITLDMTKAGSIEMVEDQLSHPDGDADFLWPASTLASEYYTEGGGADSGMHNAFYSPIVLFSWAPIVDALIAYDIVTEAEGAYYIVDLPALLGWVKENKSWQDVADGKPGLSDSPIKQLFGGVSIKSTDPARSNSGNMFAGLAAFIYNDMQPLEVGDVDQKTDPIMQELETLFLALGYMEHSTGTLFEKYINQGMGAYPIVVGYESLLIELIRTNPDLLPRIKDEVRILYPQPTVWTDHPVIALNSDAKQFISALEDPEIQEIAWKTHGFRSGAGDDTSIFEVTGLPEQIISVVNPPRYSVMEKITEYLSRL